MSRRLAVLVAALLAATAATLGSTASAAPGPAPPNRPAPPTHPAPPGSPTPPGRGNDAVPLPPDQAEALVTAPAAAASGEATTPVPASVALAASALPGAETSVDPGLTAAQAVGVAAPVGEAPELALLASFTMCWADRAWSQWGTWPYQQRIIDTTYWCAVYGQRITYRSTTVTTSGTLCSTNWRASQLIGGGIGFHGMTIRASAGFSCPTVIPWVTLHPSHYQDVFFGDRGRAVITGSG